MKRLVVLLFPLLLITPLRGQEVVDRIIAVVDDDIILESEVMQYAQSLALQNRIDPMKYLQDEAVKSRILQELIDQRVMLAMTEEDTTIVVEDREVKRELESRLQMMTQEAGSQEELERLYGMSLHDIKRELEEYIRDGLKVEKLRQKKIALVKVSREDIETFFRENRERLSDRPETVELAHILIKVEPTAEAELRAKTLIDSLREALDKGADFTELAKAYSQDPGSAKRGGLLGWTKRGDLVPEYEEAAFALNNGEVSATVKTKFGYHIIRLNERQGEKINSSHILIVLKPTEADKHRALTLADSLYGLLQSGSDFAELAKSFSQDGETAPEGGELGTFLVKDLIPLYNQKIEGLEAGGYTAPFETAMGVQLLKVKARQHPRALVLDKDWEQIARLALNSKQEKVYYDWLEKLKQEVYIDIRK